MNVESRIVEKLSPRALGVALGTGEPAAAGDAFGAGEALGGADVPGTGVDGVCANAKRMQATKRTVQPTNRRTSPGEIVPAAKG